MKTKLQLIFAPAQELREHGAHSGADGEQKERIDHRKCVSRHVLHETARDAENAEAERQLRIGDALHRHDDHQNE